MEVSAKEGTNINSLFEEISVKLLERHNKALGLKKGAKVMPNDPAQNLSYNYNQASIGGVGANRIEIVDLSESYRKDRENKEKKENSCCKSC